MENKCCTSLMDATAYAIAYNVIYNRLKEQRSSEQTLELIRVKETKL